MVSEQASTPDPDPARFDRSAVVDVLAASLSTASPATVQALAHGARVLPMARDDTLMRQGDAGPIVMVLEGYVALMRLTVDGHEIAAGVIRQGDMAGLVLLMPGAPAAVQAVALSAGWYAAWATADIAALVVTDGGLARDLLMQSLRAVSELDARLDTLQYQDAERRVARALHEYRDLVFSEPAIIRPNRLPALVGTSREMLSRVLRRLEGRGVIHRSRTTLELVDAAALASAAGAGGRVVPGDSPSPARRRTGTSSSRVDER